MPFILPLMQPNTPDLSGAVPALTDIFFEYDIVKESLVVMGFALLNTCLAGLLLRLPKGYRKAVAINSK